MPLKRGVGLLRTKIAHVLVLEAVKLREKSWVIVEFCIAFLIIGVTGILKVFLTHQYVCYVFYRL